MGIKLTGRKPINPRIIIGAIIIKHICNLDDRETIDQITENVYMQYFLEYPSFTTEPPFDASIFVTIRKRLNLNIVNAINEKIIAVRTKIVETKPTEPLSEFLQKKDNNKNLEEPLIKEVKNQDISKKPESNNHNKQNENKGRVLFDGITFLDELNWDAFNEGSHMMQYVEQYYKRFNCYPKEVLADKIYCTRDNRNALKAKGIKLISKPLGRTSAVADHVKPEERNPVESKFGQAKTAYGLDRIRARLKVTSQSSIASIILVLNLVKLAGLVSLCSNFTYKIIKLFNIFKFLLEIFFSRKENMIWIKIK